MLLFLLLSQSNSANISEDTDRHSKYQGVNCLDYYSCSREKHWLTKRWGEAGRLSLGSEGWDHTEIISKSYILNAQTWGGRSIPLPPCCWRCTINNNKDSTNDIDCCTY